MSEDNWKKVSGKERKLWQEMVEEEEPHHKDPLYVEEFANEEEQMFTPGCFGCAHHLDKAHNHTMFCNARRGFIPIHYYLEVMKKIGKEQGDNASGAGLAKRRRRKQSRRKQSRRKQSRRKQSRRKLSRRKLSRRK